MSRIFSRAITTSPDFHPLLTFFNEDQDVLISVEMEVLRDLAAINGPEAAKTHIIQELESVLGALSDEEREFALRP